MSQTAPQPENFAARARAFLTPLNLHFAGVGVLAILNLYLLAHIAFAWNATGKADAAALVRQNAQLQEAQRAAEPLRGLDAKLAQATADADSFYKRRLPYEGSQIDAELGALARRQSVKLTRVALVYDPVLPNTPGALTEVRMDATLSGDYRPLMLFLNSLERDRLFFLISGVTLTGQQSGTVNLRVKLTSYIRPTAPGETITVPVLEPAILPNATEGQP